LPFTVGSGQVIPCWDEGFKGLAKGAKADLICPPLYAYGSKGFGDLIPPDSPLLFSIEVVNIEPAKKEEPKKAEAKKEEPKKEVAKETGSAIDTSKFKVTVTQDGEGYALEKGDKVFAHYKGTLVDGTKFDSSYDRGQPLPFVVGKGSVIKCWDEGFIGLEKGAKADLICPPDYAYGNRAMGSTIPANSPLLFSIEVVSIEPAKKEEPKKEVAKEAIDTSKFQVTVT